MELKNDNASETSEFQQKFESKLSEYESQHQGSLKRPWTDERILDVMNHIRQARVAMSSNQRRTSMEYYWTSKYDIMTIADEEHLIFKRNSPNDPTVRIISRNDYFHTLMDAHKACGHGGRDKIIHATKSKFYIPRKAIETFVALCPTCGNKKNLSKKGVAQPQKIVSQDSNTRGQVDLMDFCFSPDGEFRWLLIYQDNTTKFLILRPLKTKCANEVALELIKIFTSYGVPCILQSNDGPEFTAKIIVELTAMWPQCKIASGSPKRAQGIAEKSHQDIENMLKAWMAAHNAANWSIGCHFVQYTKNASFHPAIGKSPYKALFGRDALPSLINSASAVPSSMLMNVEDEEQSIILSKHVHSDDPGHLVSKEPYENNCEDATLNDCGENSSRSNGCSGQSEVGTDQKINSTQLWSGNDLLHSLRQVSDYSHTENPRTPHNSNDQFSESFQAENFNATTNHYEFTIPAPNSNHKSRKRTISDETDDGADSFTKRSGQNSTNANDEFDIYAQYVASELRHTRDLHSVLMAKHHINNILINARMGTYRRSALASTSAHEVTEGSIKIERDVISD